jgi:hypothetical protein
MTIASVHSGQLVFITCMIKKKRVMNVRHEKIRVLRF